MREIFFKAKRIDNGEWVEGYYIYHIKRTPCVFGDSVKPEDEQHVIMQDGFSDWNMPRNTVHYDIDPTTLCQYTGLVDKNGRKIFEGDIVTTKYELGRGGFYTFEVYYNENLCQFALTINTGSYTKNKQYDWLQLTASKAKKIEVVGNVFDNPELLEKER